MRNESVLGKNILTQKSLTLENTHTHTHTYTHIYTHMHTYTHTHTYIHTYKHAHLTVAPSLIDPRPVQQIVMGETALILCRYTQDAYPAPTVDWYKNQLKLQLDDRVNATTDGLIIRDVREDDQGTYRCWVENKYGEDFLDITVAFQGLCIDIVPPISLKIVGVKPSCMCVHVLYV